MADITTVNVISEAGLNTLTYADADSEGDKFANNGTLFIVVKNDSGESVTVIGPFETSAFNDADGYCHITYSSVTSVDVAICSLSK